MITLRTNNYRPTDFQIFRVFLQEAISNIIIPDSFARDDILSLYNYVVQKEAETLQERWKGEQ